MKSVYLTSYVGGYKKVDGTLVATQMNNSNGFVDCLKLDLPTEINFTFFASSPDKIEVTEKFANTLKQSFVLDGFKIKEFNIIHDGFKGDINKTVKSSDVIFLSGGHVGTQNKFFKRINLAEMLKSYNGVLIGQSAGSMNSAKVVYDQPVTEEEFNDPNFEKEKSGLGITNLTIMPHMNVAKEEELCGVTTYQMCLMDSTKFPHYGIVDGGFIKISDGKTVAYGKTTFYKNGKEFEICAENSCKVLENMVKITKNM